MPIPNPWVILAFVLALAGAFGSGYWRGGHEERLKQQAEIAKLNAEAREVEHVMTGKVNALAQKLEQANETAKTESAKRNAAIADGTLRLSIPSTVCAAAGSTSAPADNETRAYLDPETAQALVAITDAGDEAIRKLNACIDTYDSVFNSQKGQK
jgi:prophage endopeptidase